MALLGPDVNTRKKTFLPYVRLTPNLAQHPRKLQGGTMHPLSWD